jgi:hypothetical protein
MISRNICSTTFGVRRYAMDREEALSLGFRARAKNSSHLHPDDLDEQVGFTAAESNHAKNKLLREQLYQLCHRIEVVLSKYIDADL